MQTRKQELIEERISLIERTEARGRLRESEKKLSQNIYERGVDDAGFGRIRSKGDTALFGGYSTQEMKSRLAVKENLPPSEDIKKLERRVKAQEKRIASQAGKLPEINLNDKNS